jgi:hypothetical protein
MASLREVSPSDPVHQRALDALYESAPILRDVEFFLEGGDADRFKQRGDEGNDQQAWRNVNEDVAGTKASRTYALVSKRVFTFKAKVDAVIQDRGGDMDDEMMNQIWEEAYLQGFKFQDTFFNGDNGTNAKEPDGVLALCSANSLVDTPSSGTIDVPVGNSDAAYTAQQEALEKLQNFFSYVRATHAYMPVQLRNRIVTVAKELGYYREQVTEIGDGPDSITVTEPMVHDTILRTAGFASDQSDDEILKFDQTVNGNANAASIVAVRHAERSNLTAATSAGLQIRVTEPADYMQANANLDTTISLRSVRAAREYRGWRVT